jgi:hypothetical protein
VKRYAPAALVTVVESSRSDADRRPLPSTSRYSRTVTPGRPGSPTFWTVLPFTSFQTKSPMFDVTASVQVNAS